MHVTSSLRFKICLLAIFNCLRLPFATAFDIDKQELGVSAKTPIYFYSYEGPHSKIDSREAIRQIGVSLGAAIRSGATKTGSIVRYSAVRVVETPPASGLDADIIALGVDVGVDHIRNLRWIVQGYLQAAFGYSETDAQLLATFATIYNAVYRGSWAYFSDRYNPSVISGLDPTKAGLSVRYDDWPGRTQIILPLITLRLNGISIIDPSPLTEPAVVEELQTASDQGVEVRQAMVELKERQADEIRQTAQLEREAIIEEEAKVAAEKTALESQPQPVPVARSEPKAEPVAAVKPVVPQAAAAEPEKPAVAAKPAPVKPAASTGPIVEPAVVEPKAAAIAQKEAEIVKRKEAVVEAERMADRLDADAAKDRKIIAADQQVIIESEGDQVAAQAVETVYSVSFSDSMSAMASIVRVASADGRIIAKSPLPTIRSRSWQTFDDGIVAIAGVAFGLGAVRLVKLDPTTLEMVRQGEDDIHPDSPIWLSAGRRFVLCNLDGETRLMEFDAELARVMVSTLAVHPYMTPTFLADKIVVQAVDGSPKLLDGLTLNEIR